MTVAGQTISDEKLDEVRQWVDRWGSPSNVRLDLLSLLTELQHRREAEAGTCKSCNGTGGEYNLCSDCGGSGIEFVYGGHGNVLEVPCSTCAASPSSPASGVRVKALEWSEPWMPEDTRWVAVGTAHCYWIDVNGPDEVYVTIGYWGSGPDDRRVGGRHHSLDAAKAAAQADYEARIRSALGEHP